MPSSVNLFYALRDSWSYQMPVSYLEPLHVISGGVPPGTEGPCSR